MKEPSLTTIKRLFALSNNTCAFPRCNALIIAESGTVTGKLCHIKAKKPSGPRYDLKQSDAERNAASNLILLCAQHHDIIDKEPHIYTVDILQEMKEVHEKKGRKGILPEDSIFASMLLNDYKKIIISNNKGNIIIDSPGAIQANTLTIKTQKKNIKVLPPTGTVSSDLRMRGYAKHLIDRYNEFAGSDPTRKSDFSYGAIYRNIQKTFKVKWDFIPVDRFKELVVYLQGRIDKTRQARINKGKGYKSYSSFSDYCSELMKGTSSQ
jgi:hypothetical protein